MTSLSVAFFERIGYGQLLKAATNGNAVEMLELLDEGAKLESVDEVRCFLSFIFDRGFSVFWKARVCTSVVHMESARHCGNY